MSEATEPAPRFGVLGPLRAWRGDGEVDLGPVQQRVVLAVLLLQAGHPISRQRLISAVWGDAPPARSVNLIQRHVSRLRRVLGTGEAGEDRLDAPFRLVWTDAGYLLTVPAGAVDLSVFQHELGRARAARAAGDLREAAAALHAALRLWRGPVCDGLSSPLLDAQRDRLAETRISVIEERADLDLALGQHADLIAELRDLLAEHPLRERLHGLLMLALYRAGRQADALSAYLGARRLLHEDLGVEPGEPLQRLHQQILAADPKLAPDPRLAATAGPVAREDAAPRGGGVPRDGAREDAGAREGAGHPDVAARDGGAREDPGTRPGRPLPAQLPHRIPDFTGRDAELGRLDALVSRDDHGADVVITVITGTAGVGKTALAVHWAHRISGHYPDGQLYVNLRGFDPTGTAVAPAEAIRGFLDAFGTTPQQIPLSLQAQAALYRSLLAGRRVLILLDNAAEEDQIRPLLPGSPGCLVIVTSRNELRGLIVTAGAHPVDLDLMSAAEARQLLSRRVGESRVLAEPSAADDLITLCARLPLALMLVAARAAAHPGFRLTALATELREAGGSLDAFSGQDQATNVRAVFAWSYLRLSTPARRLFRLLGLHYGPDIGTPAVVSLAGMPRDQIRPALAELARAHLVTERIPGRFAFHDLLRAYAAELADAHDSEDYRRTARHRMLDHYLHSAYRADELLSQFRDRPFTLAGAEAGVVPERPADQKHALAWFESEHAVLVTLLRQTTGFDAHIWQLAWALKPYFGYQGHWRDWRSSQHAALDAARRLSNQPAEALSLRLLGAASLSLGTYDEAHVHLQRALGLLRELGDQTGQAEASRDLAALLERQGRYPEALAHAQQALDLFRAAGHQVGEGRALNAVGWLCAQLGDYSRALTCCQQALDLQRAVGDIVGQAETADSLGYVHRLLGHQSESIICYQQAIDLFRECGDRYNEADSLASLGDVHQAFGDAHSAQFAWQSALTILDQLGHPDADRVRDRMRQAAEHVTPGG